MQVTVGPKVRAHAVIAAVLLAVPCLLAFPGHALTASPLIEPSDLQHILPTVRVLDVRPVAEYSSGHIPGAAFVEPRELDDVSENRMGFPIAPAAAATLFARLGVANDTHVVIYGSGPFPARLFFIAEFFGIKHVRVLDGGWQAWLAAGGRQETESFVPTPAIFRPQASVGRVVTAEWIRRESERSKLNIIDARSAAEYHAAGSNRSPGGHVPGAVNIPWQETLATDGRLKTANELRQLLLERGIDFGHPTIAYCVAGVRASQFYLVFRVLGADNFRLYDASWVDWSARPDMPAEP